MTRLPFRLVTCAVFCASCADPRCPPGEIRIIDTCHALPRDAGEGGSGDEDGGVAETSSAPGIDASTVVAQPNLDGGTGAGRDSGLSLQAAPSAVTIDFGRSIDRTSLDAASVRLLRGDETVMTALETSDRTITIKPSQPLVLGATYRVKLSPSIRSLDGREQPASELSFVVREGVWSATKGGDGFGAPRVAVSSQGGGVLAWTVRAVDGRANLRLAEFTPTKGLTPIGEDVLGMTRSAWGIEVATNDAGDLVASWSSDGFVWEVSRKGQTQWSKVWSRLASGGSDVAMDARGHAVMASKEIVENKAALVLRDFEPGADPSATSTVVGNELPDGVAELAVLRDFTWVAWKTADSMTGVRVSSNRASATISPKGVAVAAPTIAADPSRYSAIAAWVQTEQDSRVYASRVVNGGSWEPTGVPVSERSTRMGSPRVALDGSGRALVVWEQARPQGPAIVAASFDPRAGWASPVVVSSDASGPATKPVLAMERGGNALVLFQQVPSPEGTWVVAAPFTPDAGFDPSKRRWSGRGARRWATSASGWTTRAALWRPGRPMATSGRVASNRRRAGRLTSGIWLAYARRLERRLATRELTRATKLALPA